VASREDHGSNDLEGAAGFEHHRGPGDDDRPTRWDVDCDQGDRDDGDAEEDGGDE
jgi:hypothetical protein